MSCLILSYLYKYTSKLPGNHSLFFFFSFSEISCFKLLHAKIHYVWHLLAQNYILNKSSSLQLYIHYTNLSIVSLS